MNTTVIFSIFKDMDLASLTKQFTIVQKLTFFILNVKF